MSSLTRRAIAEMLGTAFLVFFGCGVVIMNNYPGAGFNVFGIAVAHALVLSIAITATMGISGGHVNPAVTIGMLVIRRISPRDATVYVAAQLVGAVIAGLFVRFALPWNVGHVISGGTPAVASTVTFLDAVVVEAIITFLLMSAVMGTIVATNAPRIGGFGVGLTLIPSIMVAGVMTGAAANPARAFGPAVISGNFTAQAVWWIGPIVGAILAALLWQNVLLKELPEEPLVPTK